MTAKCIFSFDCEGKWGMADHITDHHLTHLTNRNLEQTYRRIAVLLDRYQCPTTFAFVSGLTFSIERYREYQDDFHSPLIEGRPWLRRFHADMAEHNADGWFAPECLRIIQAEGRHEIASHGFTHLPLDERLISIEAFRHEMAMVVKHGPIDMTSTPTFIYPRNQIGFGRYLSDYGFVGYREAIYEPPIGAGLVSFLREWNVREGADDCFPDHVAPIRIPPGRYLNWRNGFRRRVPFFLTVRRWAYLIEDAIRRDGVVHLWTHPHNFIDGADMFDLFEAVLKKVAQAVADGRLEVVTQQEFCRQRMGLQ